MQEAKFYDAKSFTDPKKVYKVINLPDGSWKCSCPGFIFRQRKCNHIRRVQHLKLK